MTTRVPLSRRTALLALALSLATIGASCEAMMPLLRIAGNLLGTAAANYSPEYGQDVKELLVAFTKPSQKAEQAPAAEVPDDPLRLDVAMLRLERGEDGSAVPVPFEDGEVLRDDHGEPGSGDRFKLTFRPSQQCHVYAVGIDATGWATVVFPSSESSVANPVPAGQQVTIPEGTRWYKLDEYRGIETIYFLASYEPRDDVAAILQRFAGRTRPPLDPATVATVEEETVIDRGFTGTEEGEAASVQDESGNSHDVTPTEYIGSLTGIDLVITRWFDHQ